LLLQRRKKTQASIRIQTHYQKTDPLATILHFWPKLSHPGSVSGDLGIVTIVTKSSTHQYQL